MGKDLAFSALFDIYRPLLTEKQANVIEYYYNDDLSLGEIAENEGISRQGVRDAIKRGEALLLEYEAKLGVLKLRQRLGEIEEAAQAGELGQVLAIVNEIS